MIDVHSGIVFCDICGRSRHTTDQGWWGHPQPGRTRHWCPQCAKEKGLTG